MHISFCPRLWRLKHKLGTLTLIAGWLGLGAASAVERTPAPPLDNLALGKSCTMSPAPDYSHCTDPADARQLTDGQYITGHFWTQQGTVGWNNANPTIITLDLGTVEPIRGVSFNTAAGVAQVDWPHAIDILVSDDGKTFHAAGELVSLSAQRQPLPPAGYAVHRLWTADLRAHGRFVALIVSAAGYAFTDEIEVYRGEASWLNLPPTGEPVSDLRRFFSDHATSRSVLRRLREDIGAVRELASRVELPADARRQLRAELEAATGELPRLAHCQWPADFRAVLPINETHRRVFRAQAGLWRAAGLPPLFAWRAGAWEPLALVSVPRPETHLGLTVSLMANEYRAAAFNLGNAGDADAVLKLRITGLTGGLNPSWITVHEVAWTDTREGQPVAAALPPAAREGDDFLIQAPAGLPRQVWLTAHPTGIAAGLYQGQIQVAGGGNTLEVPITVRVYPMRFPDVPSLHLGGWDYTDVERQYEINPTNRALVLGHLREHFVDSPWATAGVMPRGQHAADGRMTTPPATAPLDTWLQRWPAARQYCVHVAVGDAYGSFKMGTGPFQTAVGDWIQFWAEAFRKRGLQPEQVALLLVDEPQNAQQDRIILEWAKAIRAANTGVKIWEDPLHEDPAQANQEMLAACHVFCPNRCAMLVNDKYRKYFTQQRPPGTELELHSCNGPARLLDPYAYHRLQAWECWKYGAKSTFFWAFGDGGGGSSWNEYAARGPSYTPFFLDAATVTSGKHMEAIRESIEDYEYLVMLRDRIAALDKKGMPSPALESARKLLARAPDRVLGAAGATLVQWKDAKDRDTADRVRVEILDALAALDSRP